MPKQDKNASNMPGHASRITRGRLRKIRGDTKMETLQNRYKVKFPGRSDMRWSTFKERYGVGGVKEAIKKHGRREL